jgi:hypothetical protein
LVSVAEKGMGLIDGCYLVFLAKSKDDDYHQEMNSVVFLEWFENQLMPALKNPSLVVLDNARFVFGFRLDYKLSLFIFYFFFVSSCCVYYLCVIINIRTNTKVEVE